jgi:hypothetical protein
MAQQAVAALPYLEQAEKQAREAGHTYTAGVIAAKVEMIRVAAKAVNTGKL